jgi:signal transduction histidine kinase/ActR/RegA family two-component response regulator
VADELDPDVERRGRPRRTARDWVVDVCCFLLAVAIGLAAAQTLDSDTATPHSLAVVDQLFGVLACGAVWLRRRWPVGLAVAMIPVGFVSNTAGGAAMVAVFTLAVHRPFRYVAWVGGAQLVLAPLFFWLRPDPDLPYAAAVVFTELLTLTVIGWGMFVRSKRQLMLSLRDRARRAETEAELRAEQAQRLAREAIAREMHDVLAHRLTLLSVHAGALEFRPDAPREEVARAAGVIRESAHEALQDLREIIGVLRAGEPDDTGRPQPTLGALDALVTESREAGMKVTLANRVTDPATVPASVGRTAYRIAQEALTNARKHAPGTEVTVTVTGTPGEGLVIVVRNPPPEGEVPHVPGSGQGLIGLTERATLAGGRWSTGRRRAGGSGCGPGCRGDEARSAPRVTPVLGKGDGGRSGSAVRECGEGVRAARLCPLRRRPVDSGQLATALRVGAGQQPGQGVRGAAVEHRSHCCPAAPEPLPEDQPARGVDDMAARLGVGSEDARTTPRAPRPAPRTTPPPAASPWLRSPMTAIRLLLVDDDPLVRAGLSFMLGGAADIEIVGEAADGSEVEELVDRVHPDVVLMDIRMPSVDGLTATERLRARGDAPQIVVLTTFHADEQVLRALRAGAAGFVLKDTPPAEILDAVRGSRPVIPSCRPRSPAS